MIPPENRTAAPAPDEFDLRARITLPGYEAMHDVSGCLLAVELPGAADVLVVGVGTGQELIALSAHGDAWRLTGVDPDETMLSRARARTEAAGIAERTALLAGTVDSIEEGRVFDAATLQLVLHLLSDRGAQAAILRGIGARLRAGAPFVLCTPIQPFNGDALFMGAWRHRWLGQGMPARAVDQGLPQVAGRMHPPTEGELTQMLADGGFTRPRRFFQSLFFQAWIAWRA